MRGVQRDGVAQRGQAGVRGARAAAGGARQQRAAAQGAAEIGARDDAAAAAAPRVVDSAAARAGAVPAGLCSGGPPGRCARPQRRSNNAAMPCKAAARHGLAGSDC